MTDVLSRTSLIEYRLGDFNDNLDSNLESSVYYNRKEVNNFGKSFTNIETGLRIILSRIFSGKERTRLKYLRWCCQYLS